MDAFLAWLGSFVAALFANMEALYLADQNAKKQEKLKNAQRALAQVERAAAIKRHLDATDAATAERMRAWYAHTLGGGYQLPGDGGTDAKH